jgi:hypothetical protein
MKFATQIRPLNRLPANGAPVSSTSENSGTVASTGNGAGR